MYKLTSVDDVFELTDKKNGEVVKVGDFNDCYGMIENTVMGSVEIE